MKLSVWVSALGWASLICLSWLWILGVVKMTGVQVGIYVLFFLLALGGGVVSLGGRIKG